MIGKIGSMGLSAGARSLDGGFVSGSATGVLCTLGRLGVFPLSCRNNRSSLLHTHMEGKDSKDWETQRIYDSAEQNLYP